MPPPEPALGSADGAKDGMADGAKDLGAAAMGMGEAEGMDMGAGAIRGIAEGAAADGI